MYKVCYSNKKQLSWSKLHPKSKAKSENELREIKSYFNIKAEHLNVICAQCQKIFKDGLIKYGERDIGDVIFVTKNQCHQNQFHRKIHLNQIKSRTRTNVNPGNLCSDLYCSQRMFTSFTMSKQSKTLHITCEQFLLIFRKQI